VIVDLMAMVDDLIDVSCSGGEYQGSRVVNVLLKDSHLFRLIDIASVDTFLLPLPYRFLISLMCLVSEMAYLAVLSPHAASISLMCPVSFTFCRVGADRQRTLTLVVFYRYTSIILSKIELVIEWLER
jgi:hypothetical protein